MELLCGIVWHRVAIDYQNLNGNLEIWWEGLLSECQVLVLSIYLLWG